MTKSGSIKVRFQGKIGQFNLDAAFEVPARGVTAIFGPSGCGKTSVLRGIAGLHHFKNGYCSINEDVWQDATHFRPGHKRPLGYVFQEASLFPHLSVRKNLTYGVTEARCSPQIRFDEIIDLLALDSLLERSTTKLSGGECQRVAIGRALLSQPKILLMDEPLSALDALTKNEILPYLERLHLSLNIPVVYVSHDTTEIERLADELVLMDRGNVLAFGPISQLQSNPNLPLVNAREAAVSLDATVESYDSEDRMAVLSVSGAQFLVPSNGTALGERHRLRILAGDVSLARERPNQSTIVNIVRARILSAQERGDNQITVILGLGEEGNGEKLISRVTRRSWRLLNLEPGLTVYAQVKGVALERRSHLENL